MHKNTVEKQVGAEETIETGQRAEQSVLPSPAEEETAAATAEAFVMPFDHTEEYYVEELGDLRKKPFYAFCKRVFDFTACLLGLIVLSPVMLAAAIAVKCSSKGPVFYIQERLGYKGKKIRIPKFRSMRADAEKNGAQWSSGDDDPRITKVGRFLRKTRIDELPQLWCCVIGTLSLVGPRPEREIFYEKFEEYVHGFKERLKVKPGLTGLAQVSGGYDLKPEEKILYDIEYIKKRSIWLDIKIMFRTVGVIFTHKGAK